MSDVLHGFSKSQVDEPKLLSLQTATRFPRPIPMIENPLPNLVSLIPLILVTLAWSCKSEVQWGGCLRSGPQAHGTSVQIIPSYSHLTPILLGALKSETPPFSPESCQYPCSALFVRMVFLLNLPRLENLSPIQWSFLTWSTLPSSCALTLPLHFRSLV